MKHIILILISVCALCCTNNKQTQNSSDAFAVDSAIVNDTVKIGNSFYYFFNYHLLVFPTIKDKNLLDSIYKPVDIKVFDYSKEGLLSAIKDDIKNNVKDIDSVDVDELPDYFPDFDYSVEMKLISKAENLLIIEYNWGGYSGGAHGFYSTFYKVVDLNINKSISNTDIFKNINDKKLSEILLNHLDEESKECLFDTIPLNNNFYFDENSITFVYNSYEIMPYACGMAEITLPFVEINDYLKPEFVKQYLNK